MILGYLWLNYFSDLNYDHRLGGVSAAASVVAFLAPALLISSPIRQRYALSTAAFERLLTLILTLATIIVAIGATYGFRFVSLANIYDFRDNLEFPVMLNYAITITSNSLLPFAFACFVMRRNYWQAGLTLTLLLLIYPITLSKVAFFAPWWLLFIALLSRIFEARTTVIFSLLLPVLFGLILVAFFEPHGLSYFRLVNFRMVAVPSNAMDVYNDFFANHDLTYFCQIRFLKPVIHCPYRDPLSVVMERAYGFGSFNASLFATEGIASVGPLLAPISAVVCGLVAALGNRVSAGLPPRLIVISSGILPLVFLNVPMTTTLLTHGAAILFLLWYVTPRAMFEYNADGRTGGAVR